MAAKNSISIYKDLYARLILSVVAAHFIVIYGEDESVFQLLLNRDYYVSVLASILIAFILITIVRWIIIRLDSRSDWKQHPLQRVFLQLIFGLIIPSLTAFFLASIYFRSFGIDIFKTTYLKYDYTVIVLMITLLNAYYTCYYFYWQAHNATVTQERTKEPTITPEKQYADKFLVQKGASVVALPTGDICYFYRDGDYNYLRTFNGDGYLVTQPLDDVQDILDEQQFFRANRQFLVNKKACLRFTAIDYGKISLEVEPTYKGKVIISQRRAKAFKDWIKSLTTILEI